MLQPESALMIQHAVALSLQIYVEIERARLTRKLAAMKEAEGNINEAADTLQEVPVVSGWDISRMHGGRITPPGSWLAVRSSAASAQRKQTNAAWRLVHACCTKDVQPPLVPDTTLAAPCCTYTTEPAFCLVDSFPSAS